MIYQIAKEMHELQLARRAQLNESMKYAVQLSLAGLSILFLLTSSYGRIILHNNLLTGTLVVIIICLCTSLILCAWGIVMHKTSSPPTPIDLMQYVKQINEEEKVTEYLTKIYEEMAQKNWVYNKKKAFASFWSRIFIIVSAIPLLILTITIININIITPKSEAINESKQTKTTTTAKTH
jgi:hypothetical protein